MVTMRWLVLVPILLSACLCMACDEGRPCNSTTVDKGTCIRGTCLETIPNWDRDNLTFTLTVKYPEHVLKLHGGSNLYLRGNGLGFHWNTGTLLPRTAPDTWSIHVTYTSSIAGYGCQTCAGKAHLIRKQFEYRVLVDDRENMKGANFAVKLPVSEVSTYFTSKREFLVYPWFYQQHGNISSVVVKSTELGGNRTIVLYTPPSFYENTLKTYPVIYALDFAPTGLPIPQYLLDNPIVKHAATEEFIVIGFGNYTGTERFEFLTPTRHSEMKCINGTFHSRCNDCLPKNATEDIDAFHQYMIHKCGKFVPTGGKGEDTLDFLLNKVYPVIQTHYNNRLSTAREDTGIMGYSLGGLMSCHAAWTRPQNFGFAACQSSSFWWPRKLVNNDHIATEFEFLNVTMRNATLSVSRPPQRIYIDSGGLEDSPPYWMARAAIEVAEKMAAFPGYTLDENVWVNVYPGSLHSFPEWMIRMWKTLTMLLPVAGSPDMPHAVLPAFIG